MYRQQLRPNQNRINTLRSIQDRTVACKKSHNLLFILTGLLFVATFIIQLYYSGIFASKNQELGTIIAHKQSLEKEISALQYEVAGLSSLSYVENQAIQLGFKTFKGNVLSLDIKNSQPLAANAIR